MLWLLYFLLSFFSIFAASPSFSRLVAARKSAPMYLFKDGRFVRNIVKLGAKSDTTTEGLYYLGKVGIGYCESGYGLNQSESFVSSLEFSAGKYILDCTSLWGEDNIRPNVISVEGIAYLVDFFSDAGSSVSATVTFSSITAVIGPNVGQPSQESSVTYDGFTSDGFSVSETNSSEQTAFALNFHYEYLVEPNGYLALQFNSDKPSVLNTSFNFDYQWGKMVFKYDVYLYYDEDVDDTPGGGGGTGGDDNNQQWDVVPVDITIIKDNSVTNTTNTTKIVTNTDSIKTNTDSIKSNTDSIKSNTDNIKTNTDSIVTNTNNIKSNTDSIKSNTDSIKSNTDSLVTNTDSIKTDVSNISTDTLTIAAEASNIADSAAVVERNTNSMASDLNGIATNVVTGVTVLNQIQSNTSSIDTSSATTATNSATIAGNSSTIAGNTATIAGNTATIAGNTANINSGVSDINGFLTGGSMDAFNPSISTLPGQGETASGPNDDGFDSGQAEGDLAGNIERFQALGTSFLEKFSLPSNLFPNSSSTPTLTMDFGIIGNVQMGFDSPVFNRIASACKILSTITMLCFFVFAVFKRLSSF